MLNAPDPEMILKRIETPGILHWKRKGSSDQIRQTADGRQIPQHIRLSEDTIYTVAPVRGAPRLF